MALSLKTALAIHAWVATSCAQSSAGPAPSMSVSYSTNAGVTLGMDGVTMATGMPSLVSVCPDKSSTRTFVVDADRAGATFSATSPVGSYTLKYSGAGPALAGLDMTLSFTSNASAMAKPQDLWFLPLASGGWCYHTQQDGKWAPDTTGPWSFPHYGEDTPGGSLDLGYPLPGGRGTPGLMPGPQVHFAEWAESSIVSVLPANPANTSWGWFSWGPYKWRSMLVLAAVEPGETRTVKFALRAGPGNSSSIPPTSVAQDAYANFGKLHPLQHKWPDRRPIAMVMTGIHGIDAYNRTTNPHSYDTGQPKPFDMTTAEGRAYFKTSLIAFAHQIVAVEKQRGEYAQSQGVIVWDIEGEGDPWATYDGSPNMLPQIAPEMDAVADEFMAVFNDAGLRVGVCIRPQQLTRVPNYDPSNPKSEPWEQIDLERPDNSTDNEAITKLLAEKIAYANKRWNATLFCEKSSVLCVCLLCLCLCLCLSLHLCLCLSFHRHGLDDKSQWHPRRQHLRGCGETISGGAPLTQLSPPQSNSHTNLLSPCLLRC